MNCLNSKTAAKTTETNNRKPRILLNFVVITKIITLIERRLAVSDFLASTALSRRSPAGADRRRINPSTRNPGGFWVGGNAARVAGTRPGKPSDQLIGCKLRIA